MRLTSQSMAAPIAIVTDSTSRIPVPIATEYGISVVPVEVIVNGLSYLEGVDISAGAISAALRAGDDVGTSRPAPARFLEVYRKAAAAGAQRVVSVHLSSQLSGTYQSAVLAARESPIPVEVIDSRTVSMALGYAVIAGAQLAAAGASVARVTHEISDRVARSEVFFYVDTLDYLRRGGRIGAAAALLGTALRVKPILTIRDGTVAVLEKTRTAAKALARLAEIVIDRVDRDDARLCVQYLDTPRRAANLAAFLRSRLPGVCVQTGSVGAVVGCHVGPGVIAIVSAPRS